MARTATRAPAQMSLARLRWTNVGWRVERLRRTGRPWGRWPDGRWPDGRLVGLERAAGWRSGLRPGDVGNVDPRCAGAGTAESVPSRAPARSGLRLRQPGPGGRGSQP